MNRLFKIDLSKNIINVSYDYSPGHKFGQGQISPDNNFNFVHIPKNASSKIKTVLHDWKQSYYHDIKDPIEHLVILRDPTDRWISSIAEFLVGNFSVLGKVNSEVSLDEISESMNTKMFQNLLFNFVIFDTHTLPQCCYLNGLTLDDITFFYFSDNVIPQILKYVGLPVPTLIQKTNNSLTSPTKTIIIKKLKSLVETDSGLQKRIDVHYWADHQLLDSIKFYYKEK